ncbi:MAG: FtsW/RodA/SpoVE family cell cycle protein [Clostridia bacterium]
MIFIIKAIKNYINSIDKILLAAVFVCTLFGLLLINSATATITGNRYIIVQSFAFVMGIILIILLSKFDFEYYENIAIIIYIVSVLALIITYFVADPVKGNRNWIDLGFLKLQTSEITKVTFIITSAVLYNRLKEKINSFKGILIVLLHFAGYAVPIILQGDIGSLLVYCVILVITLFISNLHILYFIGTFVLLVASTPFIWLYVLKDYMKTRILITFNPYLDPLGAGYQQIQSQTALGSGGLFGSGYMKGIQSQYSLLPEKHTDFIFSVAGEEFGFIGCMIIILLLLLVMARLIIIGYKSSSLAGKVICMGTFAMIFAQTVENIGMCCGILPIIGITLPFFSYGGSSMISLFLAIGVCMSVKVHTSKGISFAPTLYLDL